MKKIDYKNVEFEIIHENNSNSSLVSRLTKYAKLLRKVIIMREWKFENGISVQEDEFNYDLHCLKVYHGEKYLGTIYPGSIEDMENCFKDLDNGNDPISNGWEDGLGNSCTLDGWGE